MLKKRRRNVNSVYLENNFYDIIQKWNTSILCFKVKIH